VYSEWLLVTRFPTNTESHHISWSSLYKTAPAPPGPGLPLLHPSKYNLYIGSSYLDLLSLLFCLSKTVASGSLITGENLSY